MTLYTRNNVLLEDNTTVDVSEPVMIADFESIAVQFIGLLTGDIVQIEVSNEKEEPTNWSQAGTDITEDDVVIVDSGPRWLRLSRTDVSGGGSVDGILQAQAS